MAVNKVVINTPEGEQTLVDLTSDSVTPEALAEGATAHDASGEAITGTMPTTAVLYTAQTLTEAQQAQARENIGVDDAFKAELVAMVIESLGGNPVFGYVDENNNIIVSGNLADGTYSVKYEMESGETVNIGNLVLDSNVYYSVTNNLTQCTNSNSATQVIGGESYSATITANDGYELKSVTVTMGGSPVTVSGGTISIAEVTGNIVITAVAEEKAAEPTYTNLLPLSVDASGNDYKGTNGEDGYKSGYRMSTTSGNESAKEGAYCSGFMPVSDIYDTIRVKNVTLSSEANVNSFVFYDASKAKVGTNTCNGTAGAFHVYVVDEGDGVYSVTPSSYLGISMSVAFFRFSCGGITDDTIVTVNEEIV